MKSNEAAVNGSTIAMFVPSQKQNIKTFPYVWLQCELCKKVRKGHLNKNNHVHIANLFNLKR